MAGSPSGSDAGGGRGQPSSEEIGVLRALRRSGDWAALRKECAQTLRSKVPVLRVALWWAEANTNLEGFAGLAEGLRRLSGLWSHFTASVRDDYEEEDPVTIAADALETYLLQVRLAAADFTFTTVINSRYDPELEAEIRVDVAREPGRWGQLLSELQAVDLNFAQFQTTIGQWDSAKDAVRQLKKTLADVRQTLSGWASPVSEPGEVPADPTPQMATVPQPAEAWKEEYRIYLRIEGVSGESVEKNHQEWITGIAYRQSLKPPTTADETSPPTFEIDKELDRASPALYLAVYSGRVFSNVTVEVCRGQGQSVRLLRIDMSDAVIAEVRQTAASSSGYSRPTETIVFEYQKIQWTYTKLRGTDGAREGNTSSAWTRETAGSESKTGTRKARV